MAKPSADGTPARAPRKVKFTPAAVKNLQPEVKHYRVWDEGQEGLVLSVQTTGSKNWYFYYRFGGRPRWYRIASVGRVGLKAAREEAAKLNAQMLLDKSYDPQAEKIANRRAGTFGELAQRYLEEYAKPRLKSWKQSEYKIREYLLPKWESLQINSIQRGDVI
ncbi:MAG: integrase arm-type DNA-binding domain-containing protein, partial [Rhodospirillaceae bacterium]|nr:integrase arm-type DNA-binding domain-containing protein [Rhodospirillaceae bacterium]